MVIHRIAEILDFTSAALHDNCTERNIFISSVAAVVAKSALGILPCVSVSEIFSWGNLIFSFFFFFNEPFFFPLQDCL